MLYLDNTPYILDKSAEGQLAERLNALEERVLLLRKKGTLTDETIKVYYGEKRFEQVPNQTHWKEAHFLPERQNWLYSKELL